MSMMEFLWKNNSSSAYLEIRLGSTFFRQGKKNPTIMKPTIKTEPLKKGKFYPSHK